MNRQNYLTSRIELSSYFIGQTKRQHCLYNEAIKTYLQLIAQENNLKFIVLKFKYYAIGGKSNHLPRLLKLCPLLENFVFEIISH